VRGALTPLKDEQRIRRHQGKGVLVDSYYRYNSCRLTGTVSLGPAQK
jgi:DNA-binding GntR family transcriptional regulator